MSIIDKINESSDSAVDTGKKFVKTSLEYYKLKVFKTLTKSLTTVVKLVAVGGLLMMGIVFLSVSVAIALGNHIESISLGFLYVGLFYMIISVMMFFISKKVDQKIIKNLSKKFFD
ncbi:phage holin family protein [uncultured Polaribacter sp.]|uniref:phage holin family protein n=1 Tax=uncultured Polaribacter sp. TaxID=174711 RepID=UPI00262A5C81|nr:phage holin family protein [uncultured Polaribacter sp.]